MLINKCDVHTHTLFSGHAYSTVLENLDEASREDLELLGVTDHFSQLTGTTFDLREYQYFINMHMWPCEHKGVKLYRGCEADIVDLEGNLFGSDIIVDRSIVGSKYKEKQTLQERVFQDCDYVIASIHNRDFCKDASIELATQMYIGALENPKVLILGHTGRSGIPYDLDEVIIRAAELNKLIEINEHSFDMADVSPCIKIAEKCAELGVSVVVNSDAHIATAVGKTPKALEMLEKIGFPQELIATRSANAFIDALNLGIR